MVGENFSSPVQTGPQAKPASYTMSTGSFLGVKRPGIDVNHPPQSGAEIKKVWNYTPASILSSWKVIGFIYLFILFIYCYIYIHLLNN